MTNPLCIHGKQSWERCVGCESDLLAGKSNGFTRELPPSKEQFRDCEPGPAFTQAMEGDTSPVTQQEIISAVHHHASEIARLTQTWPAGDPERKYTEKDVAALVAATRALDREKERTAHEPLPGHAAWERERMAKWISKNKPSLPDHACAQCVPGGEIVVEDFECVYHMALKIAEEAVIRDKFSAHLALTKCEGQS